MLVRNFHFRVFSILDILPCLKTKLSNFRYFNVAKLIFESFFKDVIQSDFFRVMTISDSMYTMTIRKDFDVYDVKFTINLNGNKADVFVLTF